GRVSRRTLITVGSALTAGGFFWLGFLSPDGGFLTDILGPSIVTSIGFGLYLGPVVSVGTAGVPAHENGMASSVLSSTRQLGATLGLAALGAVAHAVSGPHPSPEAVTTGYGIAMMVGAAVALGASVIALTVLPSER